MTTSTINAIVDHATQSVRSYREAAAPIQSLKDGLKAHLDTAVETLTEKALALGATEEQVNSILIDSGLVDAPEPEPEPEPEVPVATVEESDLGGRVSALESSVARLTEIAEAASRRFNL